MKKKKGRNKTCLTFALMAALSVFLALPAMAGTLQDVPAFSLTRLSIAGGAGYVWHSGEDASVPPFNKEWEAGLYGAYVLPTGTGKLNLTASVVYGVDSKLFRSSVGLRFPLFVGNP